LPFIVGLCSYCGRAVAMTNNAPMPSGLQFTVGQLFLVTSIAALCLSSAIWWGGVGFFLSLSILSIAASLFYRHYSLAVGLFGLMVIGALLLPQMGTAGPAARRSQCINNIKQITLAILNYESDHGHLPPPYTTDEQGHPLHSWRVLILPYLEEQDLYNAFRLDKPWYHPDNLVLQTRMPSVYRCPSSEGASSDLDVTTAYVAILGERTAWPRSATRSIGQITDGPSKTLALLESEQHRVHWMSTADPGIEMIGPVNLSGDTLLSRTSHNGGVVFSRCDGTVGFLASDTDLGELRSWITIDGGENSP
jgi:hypothetical protein